MRSALIRCFSLILLAGCAATPSLPPGKVVGETMRPREVVAFASVDANPEAYFDRTVLVEATATAVCQKMGCWMQVEDEESTAMVRWETGCDGKYAFPMDLAGQRVLIQGSFYPKTISEEDAQHLQAESGQPTEFDREGYEFNASAILVIDENS